MSILPEPEGAVTLDRTTLPDRILTTEDGAQVEYWFGAGAEGRRRYARVSREGDGEITLLRREAEGDALDVCAPASIEEARRLAVEWTPR